MARYDLFPGENGSYLLDVQSDLLDSLTTRVVIPLLPRGKAPIPARRLNPVFQIAGQDYVLMPQFLAAVPATILNGSAGHLKDRQDEITAALDMVFHGF